MNERMFQPMDDIKLKCWLLNYKNNNHQKFVGGVRRRIEVHLRGDGISLGQAAGHTGLGVHGSTIRIQFRFVRNLFRQSGSIPSRPRSRFLLPSRSAPPSSADSARRERGEGKCLYSNEKWDWNEFFFIVWLKSAKINWQFLSAQFFP